MNQNLKKAMPKATVAVNKYHNELVRLADEHGLDRKDFILNIMVGDLMLAVNEDWEGYTVIPEEQILGAVQQMISDMAEKK